MVLTDTIDGVTSADAPNVVLEPLQPEAEVREPRPIKRGRPKGTSRRVKTDPKMLAVQLVGAHKLIAIVTQQPIIEIETAEGEQLAKAIADIVDEYGFAASKRAILWGNLVATVGIIYGPKLFMLRAAMAQRKQRPTVNTAKESPLNSSNFKMDFSGV